jgi:hypothetical protein
MTLWTKLWTALRVSGKAVLFVYTLNIVGMSWYSTVTGKKIDPQIVIAFLGVVGAYTANKTTEAVKGVRS